MSKPTGNDTARLGYRRDDESPAKAEPEEQEVGGFDGLSEGVQKALGFAVHRLNKEHGTRQGTTPLFWELVAVAQRHRGDRDPGGEKLHPPLAANQDGRDAP